MLLNLEIDEEYVTTAAPTQLALDTTFGFVAVARLSGSVIVLLTTSPVL